MQRISRDPHDGKRVYTKWSQADRSMRGLIRDKNERNLHVYPCGNHYHIGHKREG